MAGQESEGWERCPPGELRQLAARLRGRRQRRRFLWSTGSTVAAVAAAGGAVALWLQWSNPFEPNYAGIRCSKVRSLADAYGKGTLSAPVQDQIRGHLAHCGPCRSFYRERGLVAAAPPTSSGPI